MFLFLQREEKSGQQKVDILDSQSTLHLNTAAAAAVIGPVFAVPLIGIFCDNVQNQLFLFFLGLSVTVIRFVVTFGVAAFGVTAFGLAAFGVAAFGVTAFGVTAFGVTAFGLAAFGVTAFGVTAFSLAAFGVLAVFGYVFTLRVFLFGFFRSNNLNTAGVDTVFDHDGYGFLAGFQRFIYSLLNGIAGCVIGIYHILSAFNVCRSLRDQILRHRCRFLRSICRCVSFRFPTGFRRALFGRLLR